MPDKPNQKPATFARMTDITSEHRKNYYQQKINELNGDLKHLMQRKSSFAWLRLGSIAAIFFALYLLWQFGPAYAIASTVLLVFIFIRMVYADLKNHQKIIFKKTLINVYSKELESLIGNYQFDDGARFIEKDHPYASDLDIFGEGSLFKFLNRTASEPGSSRLAAYLKNPASTQEITSRQAAISELKNNESWMKEMQALATLDPFTFSAKNKIQTWIGQPTQFIQFGAWAWLRYMLPAAILTIVFLSIFDIVSVSVLLAGLLLFSIIAWQINKVVAPVHNDLDKVASELSSLSSIFSMIESRQFKSPLLQQLSNEMKNEKAASASVAILKKLLDRLDLRYNIVLSAPLNILLLWNLQQMLDLEKWKKENKKVIEKWTAVLAEFEALNSLAILHFNYPDWVFPEVTDDYFHIHGKELGHPLILPEKRVNNPVHIEKNGEIMLITGSNMAGKSTYLRCIGVNCVLALCGAPVCAQELSVSNISLISSMRIADNLQESTSTFYAELKKLKTIIDKVNAGEKVFILLDEILRGTNSFDRHTGSKALIRQLADKKTAAIIATHDLELAHLKDVYSEKILNYHFDVQVSNEELFFDYKLKPGICQSMNASILMKKIGIKM